LRRDFHALKIALARNATHLAYFFYESCKHGYSTSAV